MVAVLHIIRLVLLTLLVWTALGAMFCIVKAVFHFPRFEDNQC